MNLFASSPEWLMWLLVGLVVAAAAQDAVQLKISNVITAGVFVGAVVALILGGLELRLWQNALVFALVLAVGVILLSHTSLGGGDVNVFAAVSLWSDLRTAVSLIAAILLCGGVLALAILLLRVVAPSAIADRVKTMRRGGGIPYGVAIAAGCLVVIATSRAAI